MSFDLTLQPLGLHIATPPDDSGGTELDVIVVVGLMLPFNTGQGPMVVPMGQIRFPMGRDFAENFADSLRTEAEKLPKESGIIPATDMRQVEHVAKIERQIRGDS